MVGPRFEKGPPSGDSENGLPKSFKNRKGGNLTFYQPAHYLRRQARR